MVKYFISYNILKKDGSFGYGNAETHFSATIKSIVDVTNIARSLERDNQLPSDSLVIMNFIRLD